jgi:cbb3-type cytochrome oxidase subunit 1
VCLCVCVSVSLGMSESIAAMEEGGDILLHVSSYYYLCVLILLHMCPHTTTYVSSYYYICVLILLQGLIH